MELEELEANLQKRVLIQLEEQTRACLQDEAEQGDANQVPCQGLARRTQIDYSYPNSQPSLRIPPLYIRIGVEREMRNGEWTALS